MKRDEKSEKREIKDLQVGDKVCVRRNYSGRIDINEIKRETKTQFVLDNGEKINKVTGKIVGSDVWSMDYYYPATDETILERDRQRVENYLHNFGNFEFDLSNADHNDLQKIVDTIVEIKTKWGKKKKGGNK